MRNKTRSRHLSMNVQKSALIIKKVNLSNAINIMTNHWRKIVRRQFIGSKNQSTWESMRKVKSHWFIDIFFSSTFRNKSQVKKISYEKKNPWTHSEGKWKSKLYYMPPWFTSIAFILFDSRSNSIIPKMCRHFLVELTLTAQRQQRQRDKTHPTRRRNTIHLTFCFEGFLSPLKLWKSR